ncbi:hypothetical protein KGMB02408_16200 [Bacteroides faecalis]|uniref:6-bladed beta-propeller n=1 Tax=Bacteroides faecalis TaxID=2447885 RepID=A0A401LSZ0_9BACE|nr:hypothetical protein KGMB02408_16200 [Bacteroides faecalis]
MRKIIFISAMLLLLYSCGKQQQTDSQTTILTIVMKDVKDPPFDSSKLSTSVKYIKLDTNDSCLIRNIKKIFYINNQIIIGSEDMILFFNEDGKLKNIVNQRGEGPEEYIGLSDFDICRNKGVISVLDTRGKKIMQYDLSGN